MDDQVEENQFKKYSNKNLITKCIYCQSEHWHSRYENSNQLEQTLMRYEKEEADRELLKRAAAK